MTYHALKRAKERYKFEFTFEDLKFILNEILEGRAKEIKRENMFGYNSNQNKHYRLRYKGILIEPVVRYDKDIPLIITFWPTGKRFDRKIKEWVYRFQDENFKHLMKKHKKEHT